MYAFKMGASARGFDTNVTGVVLMRIKNGLGRGRCSGEGDGNLSTGGTNADRNSRHIKQQVNQNGFFGLWV